MTSDQEATKDRDLPVENLLPSLRLSLEAKRSRLLSRPIVAEILADSEEGARRSKRLRSRRSAWRENEDEGTWSVRVSIDYQGQWRGGEKEILQAVIGMVEQQITFLTDPQRALLVSNPREFQLLSPRPQSAELISFERETVGGRERVLALELAERPQALDDVTAVAIVPNLVQIERQLAALGVLELEAEDSPLAPLRVLLGLPAAELSGPPLSDSELPPIRARVDESQRKCIELAMKSPHFSVIHGPPGSGKTTVIAEIVRLSVDRGERVLIVSPTHVAIDNVVEKLVPSPGDTGTDTLEPQTLPVRFASRSKKLSQVAKDYWVGGARQNRGATIARRVELAIRRSLPKATQILDAVDPELPGDAPISGAVAQCDPVVCGTPIGILSYPRVKDAKPGSFDLLIVDEVSKMTVPEFLAIAVKAHRWCLVGDPEQLPPFQDPADNAVTLADQFSPELELGCSVVTFLSKVFDNYRAHTPLLVVARDPVRSARVIREQLAYLPEGALPLRGVPPVTEIPESSMVRPNTPCIAVCGPSVAAEVAAGLAPAANHPSAWKRAGRDGTVSGRLSTLVERGVAETGFQVPVEASLLEEPDHCRYAVFERMFNVYHSQPWTRLNKQKLWMVLERKGIPKFIPCAQAIDASGVGDGSAKQNDLLRDAARTFALNAISVFDWLTGIPQGQFDTAPLNLLQGAIPSALVEAVRPFVGVLEMQYRMHSSLSLVPRKLFYQGKALRDGRPGNSDCRVSLVRVEGGSRTEENEAEADKTLAVARLLNADQASSSNNRRIMIITPYTKHEALLNARFKGFVSDAPGLQVEICTVDRCQGREAEYVIINLVRNTATSFMDMPKRWNVALTRAMERLFIVGDIEKYLEEARRERGKAFQSIPRMSLLARVIEEYQEQILEAAGRAGRS